MRDYVNKNRFPGVILGLSGGIDSALSAAVAVDALGSERVQLRHDAVALHQPRKPGGCARVIAALLGLRLDSLSIEPAMTAFDAMLDPVAG